MNSNTTGIITMSIIAAALVGAIAADIYHTESSPKSEIKVLSQNELNAAQNAFCIEAGMKPILEDGKVVCAPDRAFQTIQEFWDSDLGKQVIKEKLRQEGFSPRGVVNWPENGQPRIEKFKPTNPNSFETKSKVTE